MMREYDFDTPTYTKVLENLYIGGAPPPQSKLDLMFGGLVLCAREYQPTIFTNLNVVYAPMDDDGASISMEDAEMAVNASNAVIEWMGRGLKVLVTCYAGRNRSGLVTALALCKGPLQMPPSNAIRKIRAVRGMDSLSNTGFVEFLHYWCD
jgi:hypothetical protein